MLSSFPLNLWKHWHTTNLIKNSCCLQDSHAKGSTFWLLSHLIPYLALIFVMGSKLCYAMCVVCVTSSIHYACYHFQPILVELGCMHYNPSKSCTQFILSREPCWLYMVTSFICGDYLSIGMPRLFLGGNNETIILSRSICCVSQALHLISHVYWYSWLLG